MVKVEMTNISFYKQKCNNNNNTSYVSSTCYEPGGALRAVHLLMF